MDFVFRFHKRFNQVEAQIIEYLYNHGGIFEGSYEEFAVALGKSSANASNVRGYVGKLMAKGIVTTSYSKYTQVILVTNWQEMV